jgi:hypothetical protein
LLLFLLTISCTHTKYFVVRESELKNIDSENRSINYIPISETDYKNDSIISATCNFLKNEKKHELYNYLDHIDSLNKISSYYLSYTLYYIYECEYESALLNLNKIDTIKFNSIRDLLLIDLDYEINKEIGITNFKKYLYDYQSLIDKYPENELLKKIAAIRVRYILYQY